MGRNLVGGRDRKFYLYNIFYILEKVLVVCFKDLGMGVVLVWI